MSGDSQPRVSAAQVAADLEETRTELAAVRAELAELRGQVADIAVAVKPRLDRLARRRAAADDDK